MTIENYILRVEADTSEPQGGGRATSDHNAPELAMERVTELAKVGWELVGITGNEDLLICALKRISE